MRRPVLCGSLLLILGIILAQNSCAKITLWFSLAGASFFVTLYWGCWAKAVFKEKCFLFFLALTLVLGGAFWFSLSRYPENFAADYQDLSVKGTGFILSYPQENEWGFSCFAQVKDLNLAEPNLIKERKVLLKFRTEETYLPGETVCFRGKIELPAEARNPGEFNYREYLANQEVFWVLNCYQGEVGLDEKGSGWRTGAARARQKIVEHLQEILPPREKSLLLGILFGDTKQMPEEEWEKYQRAGVVHLFAVSGLHVGLVLSLLWFVLAFFQPRPLWRFSIGALVLCGYGFMVGWSASILRSVVMALLALLALTVGRKNDLYNSWGAAAGFILILLPGELFQVGFQLSFLTTFGLLYLTPWLERRGLGKIGAVPLAAFLVSSPLLAFHFNQVSLIAPLVNIFAVLLTSFAAVLAFIAGFLTLLIPFLATPFWGAAGLIMFILSEIVLYCGGLPGASFNIATPSIIILLWYYLFLAVLPYWAYARYWLREIPRKIKGCLVFLLIALFLLSCGPFSREMTVVFLDVGQGDSIFFKTARGQVALLDGGGAPASSFSVGKRKVKPVLCHYGVNQIKLMMMSHHHLDHSEGLKDLLPYFRVGAFLQPPQEENSDIEKQIRELCRERKVPLQELTAGQGFYLDQDVFWEILHPRRENPFSENNRSLVVKVSYRDCRWLLTGDVEKEALEELLARDLDLRADILKIPHHGSLTSFVPLFYERVQPQAVIISVGENRYNQPHPEVVDYFSKKGIPVYLTREKGAIITKSDGKKIVVQTFL